MHLRASTVDDVFLQVTWLCEHLRFRVFAEVGFQCYSFQTVAFHFVTLTYTLRESGSSTVNFDDLGGVFAHGFTELEVCYSVSRYCPL